MGRDRASPETTEWQGQSIRVYRQDTGGDQRPFLRKAASMDVGTHPIEGLHSELGKLRLMLCNAEDTLARAQYKIGRVDILEDQVVALTARLEEQSSHPHEGMEKSPFKLTGRTSGDEQLASPSLGVAERFSGRGDGKGEIDSQQPETDMWALREKVQNLQNENHKLKQRIAELEAENLRQGNTVTRLAEANIETLARLKFYTGAQSSSHEMVLADTKEQTGYAAIKKNQIISDGQKIMGPNGLADAMHRDKSGGVDDKTQMQDGKNAAVPQYEDSKYIGDSDTKYREDINARLKAIEEAVHTSEASPHGRDRMTIKREQFLINQNHKITDVKLVHGESKTKYAHAVLVMRGDSYALGACVLASKLKDLGTHADVVCMVTNDVTDKARSCLAQVFDAIYEVPYLQFSCEKMTTKKQQTYYESWIAQSFTKWNALSLPTYEKVLLVDADLLPVCSLDSLFELKVPAATFSSPWANSCKEDGYVDPYAGLEHGSEVPGSMIQQAVIESLAHSGGGKGSYVALGSLVLLEPSLDTYFALIGFVSSRQPFGVPGLHSGFDEQSLVLFFNTHYPHRPWTHISQVWNSLAWHEHWLGGAEAKAYHYFNEKPWSMSPAKYPDLRLWYSAASDLLHSYPGVEPLFQRCLGNQKFLAEFEEMQATGDKYGQSPSQWESSRWSDAAVDSPRWKSGPSGSPNTLDTRPSWADIQDAEMQNMKQASVKTTTRSHGQDLRPSSRFSSYTRDESPGRASYVSDRPPASARHVQSGYSSSKWSADRSPDHWRRSNESMNTQRPPNRSTNRSGFNGNHWQRPAETWKRASATDNWRSAGPLRRQESNEYRSRRFHDADRSERW